jgi:hypothetical protein
VEKTYKQLLTLSLSIMGLTTALTAGLALALGRILPPQIPLYYSRPWGEEQLGEPWGLLILSCLALVSGIGGYFFAKKAKKDTVLGLIVLICSIVIQLIIMTGGIRILFLVT